MQKLKAFLLAIPTPKAGLALGIAGLGLCWETAAPSHHLVQIIAASIATVMLLLIALKFLLHPRLFWADIAHPIVGGVIPTFAMALMVVSKTFGLFSLGLSQAIWLIGVLLSVIFLVLFVYHRMKRFEFHHLTPAWIVPPVGPVVADVAFPGGASLLVVADVILVFGLLTYAILLPILIYRLIFFQEIPDPEKPTIAIMASPASLCLAGYLSVTASPSPNIVGLLGGIAVLMTFVTYTSFLRLLRLPFSPGYSAYTFPLVISPVALFKTADWMNTFGFEQVYADQVLYLAWFELAIATIIVLYVTLHYMIYFYRLWRPVL